MERLETRVRSLDDRLRTIEDVEEIEKLQLMYGDYLQYGMWEEAVVDLFSDNAESFEVGDRGVYLGKEGIKRICRLMGENRVPRETSSWGDLQGMIVPRVMFHLLMIDQPVIDVDPGGKVACGRSQALELVARPTAYGKSQAPEGAGPVSGTWVQYWGHGMYQNEFIKEEGKWRFRKLHFYLTTHAPYETGWLTHTKTYGAHPTIKPDRPSTGYHPYPDPEWCTVPFHYKHPYARAGSAVEGHKPSGPCEEEL